MGALFSAVIASLIFNWQVKRWSRHIPSKFGKKGAAQLLKEYRNTNRIAKTLSLLGLSTAFLFYRHHETAVKLADWRGFGVALGLMAFLPLAYIVVANSLRGTERVKEALVAYVNDQRTPPKVLFVIMGVCLVTGAICAVSLLLQPP